MNGDIWEKNVLAAAQVCTGILSVRNYILEHSSLSVRK